MISLPNRKNHRRERRAIVTVTIVTGLANGSICLLDAQGGVSAMIDAECLPPSLQSDSRSFPMRQREHDK